MADNVSFETEFGEVTMKRKKNWASIVATGAKDKVKVWWGKNKNNVELGIGVGVIALGAYCVGRLVGAFKNIENIENCEFTQVTDNDEGFILHAVLDKGELAKAGLENNYQLVLKRFGDAVADSSVDVIDI